MRTTERDWPDLPELAALLPFVLSVWMDGVLTAAELEAVREVLVPDGTLTPESATNLGEWLDPERPPTAPEIQLLGSKVRAAGVADRPGALASVTDLGLALWERAGGGSPWDRPEEVARLRSLEASLEILGAEAARRMSGRGTDRTDTHESVTPLDPAALNAYLDADRRELRLEVRRLLTDPEIAIPLGLPYEEHRRRVLSAVLHLADRGYGRLGYPERFGGGGDPGAAVAVFETLAYGDQSVVVKFGVQFGLFGGSVLQLGTDRHHERYLRRIGTLELPGCYAMTESGHGSNVRDLETIATYEPETDELVVHSPADGAGKDWIGNAAVDGRLATVFARLVVGGRDHGVHAILVPIRSEDGSVLPRVRIEDRGLKVGLNGVDNGRIWFDGARVPRANLLDRFGAIDADGVYESPISSSGRRFFTMLRTLVAGRVSIASASVSAAKVGLTIAVRYADRRRQFGAKSAPERPILEYPLVQRALLPRLATTFGLHFAVRSLQREYASVGADGEAELEVRAAGLKAYASEHCADTLQACREACGGQGYSAENRIGALRADTDVYTTFEGANGVLYQLVAKGLLSRFRDQMGDLNLWRALRYLGERAETRITELNPVVTRRTEAEHLRDPAFHEAALSYREERLLRSAAQRVRARLQQGMDSFDAVTEVQDHLVALARAHVERIVLDAFLAGAEEAAEGPMRDALRLLGALFALERIEASRAWFLEAGYLESHKSRAIRAQVSSLCAELEPHAVACVDAFGVPEGVLPPLVRVPSS